MTQGEKAICFGIILLSFSLLGVSYSLLHRSMLRTDRVAEKLKVATVRRPMPETVAPPPIVAYTKTGVPIIALSNPVPCEHQWIQQRGANQPWTRRCVKVYLGSQRPGVK